MYRTTTSLTPLNAHTHFLVEFLLVMLQIPSMLIFETKSLPIEVVEMKMDNEYILRV